MIQPSRIVGSFATLRKRLLAEGGLARNSGITFLIRLLDMAFAYLLVVLLARFLGLEDFGRYAFALSVINLLVIPGRFGLEALLVREASKAADAGDVVRVSGLKSWAYRRAAAISLLIVGVALAVIWAGALGMDSQSTDALLAGLVLVLLIPLAGIRAAILRGVGRIAASQLTLQIVRPTVQLVLVLCLWLAALSGMQLLPATAGTAMGANVAGALASWAIGAWLLGRVLPKIPRADRRKIQIPGWRSSVAALGIANAVMVIDSQLGVVLLSALDSEEAAGLYRVAAQFAMLTTLGYTAVNIPLGPRIAAHWARGEQAAMQLLVRRGSQIAVLAAFPVMLFFLLAGQPFLAVTLGQEFADAHVPLLILSAGQLLNAAFGSATSLLTMTHHEKYNTAALAAGLLASVALSVILIPLYGVIGMAFAAASSILLRNLLLWIAAMRLTGTNTACWARIRDKRGGAN